MLKISFVACAGLSQVILAKFALKMHLATKNRQKIHKNHSFWCSCSSKVIALSANQKPVYNFLLVINSNLSPILHRF